MMLVIYYRGRKRGGAGAEDEGGQVRGRDPPPGRCVSVAGRGLPPLPCPQPPAAPTVAAAHT